MFSLDGFVKCVQKKGLNLYAVIVTKDGERLGEHHWRSDLRMNIHSLSKSFTSCAVGMALEEGLIHSLDDRVIDYFPDKLDAEPGQWLRKMTIRCLLTMSSGHEKPLLMGNTRDELEDTDWVHYCLNQPLCREPGTLFLYDTGCTFLVSAILEKQSGQHLVQYLKPRLFDPLGIRNPQWFTSPDGIALGGGGLHLNCDEITRFAQMLLDGGVYKGERLVPEAYLKQATAKQIDNAGQGDWGMGYGFQFWRCVWPGAYRGDGAYGQFALILPEQNAHICITSHEERSIADILDSVWEEIAPQL